MKRMEEKLDRILAAVERLETRVDGCVVAIAELKSGVSQIADLRAEVGALRADMETIKTILVTKFLAPSEATPLTSGAGGTSPGITGMAAKPR